MEAVKGICKFIIGVCCMLALGFALAWMATQ